MIGWNTTTIRARFRAGFGYSCGQFDPISNIEEMVNQVANQIRALPGQFQQAAQAAIAGLPSYLIKRANPQLHTVLTETINKSYELFQFSYKSCEQIEAEVAANDSGYNPYHSFVKASIGENWELSRDWGIGNAMTMDQVQQQVETDGAIKGVKGPRGNQYGGFNQPEIRINRDIIITGYNLLINRTPVTLTSAPTVDTNRFPLVALWNTPLLAVEFVTDAVGEQEISLVDQTRNQSRPGRGLKPLHEEMSEEVISALTRAVNENVYNDIKQLIVTVQVGIPIVEAIRELPVFERSVAIERLALEMSLKEIQNRVSLVKDVMRAGLSDPDLVQAQAHSTYATHIRQQTIPDLDAQFRDIFDSTELKLATLNRTTNTLMSLGELLAIQANAKSGTPVRDEQPLLDGGVAE